MHLLASVVFASAAVCAWTATMMPGTTRRHHHHSTKEPYEMAQTSFYYDAHSNVLVAKIVPYCYLVELNPSEQQSVHTPTGLRQLEVRAFQLMTSAVHEAIKGNDLLVLSNSVGKLCRNETLIKIHD